MFNMTNVDATDAFLYPDAMVDYASAVTFELRESMGGDGHDGEMPIPLSPCAELTPLNAQCDSASAMAPMRKMPPPPTSPTTRSLALHHSTLTSMSLSPNLRCAFPSLPLSPSSL